MSLPARNPFAASLAHVPPEPPRQIGDLPGLSLKRIIRGLWFIPAFFLAFSIILPGSIFFSDDMRASRIPLKQAHGKILATGWSAYNTERAPSSGPNTTAALGDGREIPTSLKFPQPRNTPGPQSYRAPAIQYVFRVPGGSTYYGSAFVSEISRYKGLKTGAPLPISYDPKDPTFNGLAGEFGKNDFPVALLFVFPLFAVVFTFPMFLIPVRPLFPMRRVYRRGLLTTGKIVFVTPGTPPSPYQLQAGRAFVSYTFQNESGETIRGRQSCDNQWLLNKLDPGSEITVVYLPRGRHKSLFLEPFID